MMTESESDSLEKSSIRFSIPRNVISRVKSNSITAPQAPYMHDFEMELRLEVKETSHILASIEFSSNDIILEALEIPDF